MNKLQETRTAAGLTQKQLAEKAGLSYSLICKYERGEEDITKAQYMTVRKLCEVLNCNPDDII